MCTQTTVAAVSESSLESGKTLTPYVSSAGTGAVGVCSDPECGSGPFRGAGKPGEKPPSSMAGGVDYDYTKHFYLSLGVSWAGLWTSRPSGVNALRSGLTTKTRAQPSAGVILPLLTPAKTNLSERPAPGENRRGAGSFFWHFASLVRGDRREGLLRFRTLDFQRLGLTSHCGASPLENTPAPTFAVSFVTFFVRKNFPDCSENRKSPGSFVC